MEIRRLDLRRDKKGIAPIVTIFIVLFALLLLAFVGTVMLAGIKWGSNQIAPITESLGTADINGGTLNFSDVGRQTFGTLDTIINLLPLLTGFAYLIMLIGCLVLVFTYRATTNPLYMGLYFAFVVLLILFSILISNAYQDLYEGNDVIAIELQAMTINSFLILYSPIIFGAVALISGIFLFSGKQVENVQQQYGY